MTATRRLTALLPAAASAILLACSGESTPSSASTQTPESAPAEKAAAALPRTPAPDGARTFIVAPADGATVSSPFTVTFGAENIEVIAAGKDEPGSGHHHLLIDAPLPDFGQPIPKSEQYLHFGGGQTETTLELAPGTYELQLLFGDHLHIPHEPPVYSEKITITVE